MDGSNAPENPIRLSCQPPSDGFPSHLRLSAGVLMFSQSLSRRGLFRFGAASILGLSLPGLLKLQASQTRRAGQAKNVLVILEQGGLSHIDTWDPKPGANGHPDGTQYILSGARPRGPIEMPDLGCVTGHLQGSECAYLPPYIMVPGNNEQGASTRTGFLPASTRVFKTGGNDLSDP